MIHLKIHLDAILSAIQINLLRSFPKEQLPRKEGDHFCSGCWQGGEGRNLLGGFMRTIKIEFNIPSEYEDDYSDVCADIAVEDFLKPEIGFRVIYDSKLAKPPEDALVLPRPRIPVRIS